jgi:hypothetical protein
VHKPSGPQLLDCARELWVICSSVAKKKKKRKEKGKKETEKKKRRKEKSGKPHPESPSLRL